MENLETVVAPEECSIIEQPELTIHFFRKAETAYQAGMNVEYDFSRVTSVTETAAAILISHIKDRNINAGKASDIVPPENQDAARKLRRLGVFKKVSQTAEQLATDIPIQKLSSLKVANIMARELVRASTQRIYGGEKRVSELYSMLIELMANTNNHADTDRREVYPWWLFSFVNDESNTVKFVFLDLGVGMFESIPVKQWVLRNPFDLRSKRGDVVRYQRGEQLTQIFANLASGKIKSSTLQSSRGKGIPHIINCAISGHFSKFLIVSNDAYIDVLADKVSSMNENFSGTLYFFELQEKE